MEPVEISGVASREGWDVVVKKLDEEITKERAKKAFEIGMQELAEQDRKILCIKKAMAWCKKREIFPISQADREVWEEWLPTGYANGGPINYSSILGGRWWYHYNYLNDMPKSVCDLIAEVKPFFSFLEIRTPKKQSSQVMYSVLFGHIQHPNGHHNVVLLAQWGENGANSVDLNDVKYIIKARTGIFPTSWGINAWKIGDNPILIAAVSLAFFAVGLVPAITLSELGLQFYSIPVLIFLAALPPIAVAVDWIVTCCRNEKLRKTHPHLFGMM